MNKKIYYENIYIKMVPHFTSIYLLTVFCGTWPLWHDRRGAIFSALAGNNFIIRNRNKTKEVEVMSKAFLFIGAIIFAIYLYLMFYNIYKAHRKQKKNHYPDLSKDEIFEEYADANQHIDN